MSNNQQEQIQLNPQPSVIDLTKSSSDLAINTQKTSPIPPKFSPKSETSPSTQHAKNRRKKKPKKVTPTAYPSTSTENLPSPATPVNPQISSLASNDTKFDSDGCETIDKIAMMVSSITQSAIPLLNLPPNPPSQSNASDVENKLEELFSETKPEPPPVPVEEKLPEKPTTEAPPKVKKPRRKKPADGAAKRQPKKAAGGETKGRGKGDKSAKAKGDNKDKVAEPKKKAKENGRSRVKIDTAPFVQIQSDGTFAIVNQTVNGDDDTEKAPAKPKKPANERHKQIRGLHVSTLSNKYDVHKRDMSWVCVFCKIEPHKHKLGDLFGPYIISKTSKEFSLCLEDPENDIFRQGNKNKFMPVVRPPAPSPSPKKKRKNSEKAPSQPSLAPPELSPEVFNGMTKIDDDHFEIWFHEDCIVWAPGTYIVGSKVNGLEAAVWQSTRHQCTGCHKNGAMMACLKRGCKNKTHFVCGQKTWKLCDDFKTFCELHST